MATVALQVVHSSKSTPLLPTTASLHPPPLEWSSSPLAGNSSTSSTGSLQSSGSKSDSSGTSSSTEEVPTPKDIINNAAAAYANINRKRRVVWDLTHRSSCLSSPRHRYHPYNSHKPANNANASTFDTLQSPDCVAPSSSSLPSRRTSVRHRRTSSKTSFKPPRSILKCLRNAKVSQYSLTHSSPGKRALHPSPGGRTFFAASPTASPGRRSSAHFASTRSPGRSPGRSPRVSSLSFGSKSPSLADITRLNGGGRKHTVAFPDLHAPKLSELASTSNGTMMMSMSNGESGMPSCQTTLSPRGLLPATSSSGSPSGQAANGSSYQLGDNVGLGLGQPFEGNNITKGEASSNDADPRMHIISACHTLKHSLASAVWRDPSSNTAAAAGQEGAVEEDCFDSQPFDFAPRNVEQALPEETSTLGQAAFPSVHLRELEAAYATVFQYAQMYIQAWYNVATPESASTSNAVHQVPSSSSTPGEDHLDHEFAKLAPMVLKCVSRDVYRALHPVPVMKGEAKLSTGLPENHKEKASPTIEQTKEARQALLHRSGLSNGTVDGEVVSSSPLTFPSPTPDNSAGVIGIMSENPKRIGRSTTEMRRRRNEINVVEAALQAFGTLVSCERFWRYFDVTTLQTTMCEIAEIPTSNLFKGPKHRDLLSSFNWIIANQTLSTPAYLATASTLQPLKLILDPMTNAVMSTIESSTKNGEKARRVLSESFRALRTLLFAYPSHVIGRFTSEDYIGKVAFFAKYLCSPTKALRDNSALLLSAIAFAITANWDDRSTQGQVMKAKAQEMVSLELYKCWTLSPNQIEIEELSRHLNSALETRLLTDYHFVRLVVTTMPIVLGRRFRKMERKGPHMWLTKAIELKKREDLPNSLPTYPAVFHLMIFLHVTYAWANSSKEVAGKHLILHEQLKRTGDDLPLQSDGQKVEEGFWGLGDKALRVVAQNVDAVVAKPWTRETYSNLSTALELDATVALILTFVYAFTGLSYTAYQTVNATNDAEKQRNPNLHRDLSKVWDTFTGKYVPNLLKAGAPRLRLVGWQTMHALLRAGEEHPSEDAALRLWSIDRVINWRMLGTYASQASQTIDSPDLILAETVKPSEIPSLDASWVFDHRAEITGMFQEAMKALAEDMVASKGVLDDALELEDWVKNADGHSIMPSSMSNCIRAFLNTLRAAVGHEDSHAEPTDAILEVVFEMCQFILCAVDAYLGTERDRILASGLLNVAGVVYSTLPHLAGLLEQTFGTTCMQTAIKSRTQPSTSMEIAQSALTLPLPRSDDKQACSAYLSMADFVFKSQEATSNLVQAAIQNIVESIQEASGTLTTSQFAMDLWCKTVSWVSSGMKTSLSSLPSPAKRALLEYAPCLFVDKKPEECVRTAYAAILSNISSSSPTIAWKYLREVAEGANGGQANSEAFLAWATLPLIREVSLVEDESFFEQISKTAAIAASALQSTIWSSFDIAISLTAGLSKVSAGAAVRVILSLQDTLVTLCKSETLSRDARTRLYQAMIETFELAYQHQAQALDLEPLSKLLLCRAPDSLNDFARLWNATYGTASGALVYTQDLKDHLQAALNEGYKLDLPGWPVQMPSEVLEKVAALPSEDHTEHLSENPSGIEESNESETIPETQPNAPVESSGDLLRATSSVESAAISEESQNLAPMEETQERVEDISSAATATQVPNLSRIPEIVDTSDIYDGELASGALVNSESAVEDEKIIEESFEETDTSVIPETQVTIAEEERKDQSEVANTSDTLQVSTSPADASLTETILETQVSGPPTQEPDISTRTESPELSEIEETQIQEQSILGVNGIANSSKNSETTALRTGITTPEENVDAAVAQANLSNASACAKSTDSIPETVANNGTGQCQRSENAVSVKPSSLPSPASSASSSKSGGKAVRRPRQIVEVVIPYRPELPRYPSTARCGDDDSQQSTRTSAGKPVGVIRNSSIIGKDLAAVKTTTVIRKHSRDSSEGLVSENSSMSKRQRRASKDKGRREPPKIRLADIVQSRYSQERPHKTALRSGSSRQLKKTTSLPTIIHSKAVFENTHPESDDETISSSEEEICVASSPNTSRRIGQTSDSVEIAKKLKRSKGGSRRKEESHPLRANSIQAEDIEEGPTSSSPTTAASQRPRSYSQSTSVSGASTSASLGGASSRANSNGSASSRGTNSTARTGLQLAKLLTDGGDSDLQEVLNDLSENQMKKLHQQLEDRLKREYGLKPVKKRRRT